MLDTINNIKEACAGGYSRPKSQRDTHLDYGKVDWGRLQDQLDSTPHGNKKWVIHFWTQRLACSRDSLYLGLRKFKAGVKAGIKAEVETKVKDEGEL